LIANRVAQLRDTARGFEIHLPEEDFSRERVAVRMKAARCDAEDGVAGPDGFSSEHAGLLDHAHDGAAQVVFTRLVEAGHLDGKTIRPGDAVLGIASSG